MMAIIVFAVRDVADVLLCFMYTILDGILEGCHYHGSYNN